MAAVSSASTFTEPFQLTLPSLGLGPVRAHPVSGEEFWKSSTTLSTTDQFSASLVMFLASLFGFQNVNTLLSGPFPLPAVTVSDIMLSYTLNTLMGWSWPTVTVNWFVALVLLFPTMSEHVAFHWWVTWL